MPHKRNPIRIACATRLLPLVLLLTLPAAVQAQFTFVTNNGSITITGYTGPGGDVIIPSTITGRSVTTIGPYAFYGSAGLTSAAIPNTVTEIGSHAFEYCSSMSSVTIGNSTLAIRERAFAYCTSLITVSIPNSVISVGDEVFFGCASLIAITVDPLNPKFSSIDGVLFARTNTVLIQCPGARAGSYTIPNGVIVISYVAFFNCTRLSDITIPDSVKSIGAWAFSDCLNLTNICGGSSVEWIDDGAFQYCTGLTGVTIGGSVTSIGRYAFQYCTGLTSAIIGNGLTKIEDYTFQYCSGLTSVTLGRSVTNVGGYAFQHCGSLTGFYFRGNAPFEDGIEWPILSDANGAKAYYFPGTIGWGPTFRHLPTVLWNGQVQTSDANFGVRTNRFGFRIIGTPNIPILVDACSSLVNPAWVSLQSCTLTNGSLYFSDPQWTNHPARFYRLRWP